ncbi:heavy metal-associated isoprenylated plant protein 45-like [Cucurbita maxima]|uniref:Heavy metal-associated isoprenylated plant protein 45-like n=1 Tax=Cucurbita maxima TaxID=3661 RepID=A0A6J1IE28_CUCMA|nr:heavy metal-associated isoprenylated plant protein 45-like [Cucurbita maxima]
MGKLHKKISKALDCFSLSLGPSSCSSGSCFCINSMEEQEDEFDKLPLIATHKDQLPTLKDVVNGNQTLAFQLKPKMVTLRVSMHCRGCARKVEKHISKMEGVSSYTIDLETKMVIIIGDILPFEVVESVSKVKNAQLWQSSLA